MIETSSRHRLIGALKRLEAMFGVLVPEVESTVAACGGKGAHGMEGHSIDSIQFGVFRVRVLPVTLEGKVLLATSFALVEVLRVCQVSETHHQHRHC